MDFNIFSIIIIYVIKSEKHKKEIKKNGKKALNNYAAHFKCYRYNGHLKG
jgi:hypothetical protein